MTEHLLTQEEAAQLLSVKSRTLEGWRMRGGGPKFVRLSARCVRYRPSDLQAWVQERIAASTSDA